MRGKWLPEWRPFSFPRRDKIARRVRGFKWFSAAGAGGVAFRPAGRNNPRGGRGAYCLLAKEGRGRG